MEFSKKQIEVPKKDYSFLLADGDKIRKLLHVQRSELQDYINLCKIGANNSSIWWDSIKSNWVTESMDTIWILTERYFNSDEYLQGRIREIGTTRAPASLIQWILDNDQNKAIQDIS